MSDQINVKFLKPENFKEYKLIDSGNFEKLEQFGKYILIRPEPQAIWDKSLSEKEWEIMASASFKKEANNPEKGKWEIQNKTPEKWAMNYMLDDKTITFKIALSSFKHVGLFPEQASNWDYIYDNIKKFNLPKAKVLNLFAYTGIASLAANCAGADVTHVDSIKQVISWARDNMEQSHLDNIRWIVDDAMKFVKREVKRGNKYNGIILDPPAYGRGPEGEKWIIEDHLNELLKLCSELIEEKNHFFIINLYSLSFSPLIVENLIKNHYKNLTNTEFGELYLNDQYDKKLPLGTFYRFNTNF